MIIERPYSGSEKPLKRVLPDLFPELTYSELQACLRRRDVKIDGVRASASAVVSEGNVVSVYPKKKKSIVVLFEDQNLLACYKPKGIASQGEGSFETLVCAEKGAVTLMHRLDTNTDGVLLFSKNPIAEKEITSAMKEGRITKIYQAEVYGHPPIGKEISLDYYYKKDQEKARAMISDRSRPDYLPVHLSFHVIKQKEESSLLEVTLHKGKMHQIRAMLAFYGFFILGDGKYGSDEVNRRLGVQKTLLTARVVSFAFPQSSPLSYLNETVISIND